MKKTCSKCREVKSFSDFPKNRTRKDGITSTCKVCQRKYIRAHYEQNKKYYKQKARNHELKMRAWIRELKSSTPCKDCRKSYSYYVMDFDHLSDKTDNISQLLKTASKQRLEQEINKCEIVCANCHRERTQKRLTSSMD